MNNNDWLVWAIILVTGFPVMIIFLGEIIERLTRFHHPLVATLISIRNLLLPVSVFLLFTKSVLQIEADNNFIKAGETFFWVCVINTSLSLLNALLFAQAGGHTWRARVPKLLIDLSRLFLILLGVATVLALVWKADIAGLAAALGVGSIVIGLALQDTLGSIMSGIALLFERPFSVGDWLGVGDIIGQVIDVNWRSVRLQTREKEMVILPHQVISREIVRNFSLPLPLHAERLLIGFSYNDPPNFVKEVLKVTALTTVGILINPEPEVRTISYDDFAITYEVRFYISDYINLENIRDRFMTRIWYAAQRNRLTIPFPIRTLYHFHGPTAKATSNTKKFEESLQSTPVFFPLTKERENLDNLAKQSALEHFGLGEKIVRYGDPGQALYVIVVGRAVMNIKNNAGKEQEIMTLSRGDFFGEIALFTGEPSTVTVMAIEDLEVMVIYPDSVNDMIERQPSLAREIGQIIESRRKAIELARYS